MPKVKVKIKTILGNCIEKRLVFYEKAKTLGVIHLWRSQNMSNFVTRHPPPPHSAKINNRYFL